MHNLYANFVKIIDVCKRFSKKLVNGRLNCRQHRRRKNRLAAETRARQSLCIKHCALLHNLGRAGSAVGVSGHNDVDALEWFAALDANQIVILDTCNSLVGDAVHSSNLILGHKHD